MERRQAVKGSISTLIACDFMAKKVDEYSQGSGGSQRWKSLELDFPVRPQTSPLPLSALHPLEAQPQLSPHYSSVVLKQSYYCKSHDEQIWVLCTPLTHTQLQAGVEGT